MDFVVETDSADDDDDDDDILAVRSNPPTFFIAVRRSSYQMWISYVSCSDPQLSW